MDLSAITAKGASDYYSMKGEYLSPYQRGTPEHDAYERGWMQSLKRDGARLVNPLPPSSKPLATKPAGPNLYELARKKR